tara:strand:- start:1038 stop:1502 length:465 start_codon:yes stop_codon:yes gene_type:complete
MIEYRDATLDDLAEIVRLTGIMHAETVWGDDPKFKFSAKKMARSLFGFIKNQPETFAKIAVHNRKIVGMLFGDYGTMLFSDARQARENLIYVHKDYRGGMTGPRLMKMFIAWAKSVNAAEAIGGANAGINPERIQKLWGKLGMSPLGYTVRARL